MFGRKKTAMEVKIRVAKLANLYIAMTRLGGIDIRGGTRPDPVQAVQSLFAVLSGESGNRDDSLLAVSLAYHDTNLEHALLDTTTEDD